MYIELKASFIGEQSKNYRTVRINGCGTADWFVHRVAQFFYFFCEVTRVATDQLQSSRLKKNKKSNPK